MRNFTGVLALALALLPQVSIAADVGVNATTLFRFEERAAPGFAKETVVPATQFFTVDLGKTADGNLSFHLSGWGRLDFAERSASNDNPDGDLTYGYLMYSLPRSNAQVKAGRFFLYDVGTVEQVDGVSARIDLQRGFSGTLFGGRPVEQDDFKDNRGNFITGGRIGYRGGRIDAGISALHETGAWSRAYDPAAGTARTVKKYRQLLGGDVWASPVSAVEISGRALYDTAVKEVAEQTYLATWRPSKHFSLTADYNRQQLESMFAAGNFPLTMFRPIADTTLTSYGGVATYTVTQPLEVSADYREMRYRSGAYGNSKRYGFGARLLLQERIRLGASYHRLDSGGDRAIPYNEFHLYGIYSRALFFASLDLIGHTFDRSIYGKDYAFEATLAAGYRVTPQVGLAGDISYAKTPLMKSETRGVFKLNYNYENQGAR